MPNDRRDEIHRLKPESFRRKHPTGGVPVTDELKAFMERKGIKTPSNPAQWKAAHKMLQTEKSAEPLRRKWLAVKDKPVA